MKTANLGTILSKVPKFVMNGEVKLNRKGAELMTKKQNISEKSIQKCVVDEAH